MKNIKFGIERSDFLENFYENKYYHNKAALLTKSVTWEMIDRSLFSWPADDGTMVLFKDGRIEVEKYVESFVDVTTSRRRVKKDVLYSELEQGATLILNKINGHLPEINDLCKEIAQFVGVKTNANGYVAFSGDGSFGKHWDTHDVFAVQIIGKKLWKIFKPTFEKPMPHQGSKEHNGDCPTTPILEIVLEAGDILYLPRGWWHEVVPISGEESFHIAVGLFPPKLLDFPLWTAGTIMPNYKAGRESVHQNKDNNGVIADFTNQLCQELRDPDQLSAFFEFITQNERVYSRFDISTVCHEKGLMQKKIEDISVNISRPHLPGPSLVANGIKLNLNQASCDLLTDIKKTNDGVGASISECAYSITDNGKKTLKTLISLDVIDVVYRT